MAGVLVARKNPQLDAWQFGQSTAKLLDEHDESEVPAVICGVVGR